MITRYSREPMARLWTDQARFEAWWKVELAVLEARAERSGIPADVCAHIRNTARFSPDEIAEVEADVQHDVIAFLTVIARYVGPNSRYIHQGLTSSDVLDTAFALQIKDAAALLLDDMAAIRLILTRRAREFRHTPTVGRTHGIHAEPTVFGLKFALWEDEFARHETRMWQTLERVLVGKLSGAVGNYAHTDTELEEAVMKRLGLGAAPISTQIVARERHAEFLSLLALIASTVERIATEVRHLQRTEVAEAFEPFGKKQKGSSAMPHKRNPILCERLCGMARLLRGYAMVGLENVSLWHERDISHSSAERVVFPDACIALDYMLHILIRVLDGLDVRPERMQENLDMTHGLLASERVLLALTETGWTRERAYSHVQAAAHKVLDTKTKFLDELLNDSEVREALGAERMGELVRVEPRYDMAEKVLRRLDILED
ncbi:adenylosuccinate lyase [bacterium]|nr:adenylosuccinate lyase [bacterium]MBU1983394.1 adenylosuccinate lyase [bacterium]